RVTPACDRPPRPAGAGTLLAHSGRWIPARAFPVAGTPGVGLPHPSFEPVSVLPEHRVGEERRLGVLVPCDRVGNDLVRPVAIRTGKRLALRIAGGSAPDVRRARLAALRDLPVGVVRAGRAARTLL